jgi:protein-tyrosine-phosphatase
MPTILFVCTANQFRSPIAAACFRKELKERETAGEWQVLSAGTWGTGRLPAAKVAVREANQMGLDLAGHASHGVHAQQMRAADLVIVMEEGQKDELRFEFPESAGKIYLLGEAATGKAFDVPDPGPFVTPAEVTSAIERLIHNGFDRICSLIEAKRGEESGQQTG